MGACAASPLLVKNRKFDIIRQFGMEPEKSVRGLIQKAYDSLKTSNSDGAKTALEEALKVDFEDPEPEFALKCLLWWQERLQNPGFRPGRDKQENSYEKGGFILSQWKSFYGFLDRIGGHETYDNCLYAVKHYVFSSALGFFEDLLGDGENQHDPGLLLMVGRCYKGIGNYGEALRYLEQAARFRREDGETLSELADVNALLEETRAAKALFREAFFAEPRKVELRNMESALILRLAGRVRELGYDGDELLEWIPVYGAMYGVFSVKRVLKLAELGKLKQTIFSLENELRTSPDKNLLIPRLINRYLWLIDHLENTQGDPSLIEEIMLKIKLACPAVYEQYRN
jgi:tetratricopeptide (TPR) repeat protein